MGHRHGRGRWDTAGRIPNQPLREAYLASGLTLSAVCHRLGWVRPDRPTAEVSGLKRALGIESTKTRVKATGHLSETWVSTIAITKAVAICEAIHADFDELYPELPATRARGGRCGVCDNPLLRPVRDGLCGFCREESEFGSVAA